MVLGQAHRPPTTQNISFEYASPRPRDGSKIEDAVQEAIERSILRKIRRWQSERRNLTPNRKLQGTY